MFLLLIWGCSNDLTGDPETLFSKWAENPIGLRAELEQESDALKRLHKITILSEQFPGQTQSLCPLLTNETDQARCMQLNARPHLWAKETPKTKNNPIQSTTNIIDSGCPKNAVYHSCVSKAAAEAAQRGQSAKAQGLCFGIESPKWASECLFSSAEATVNQRGPHGYSQALELCLEANAFAENCLQHLVMLLAHNAPNANATSQSAWETIFQAERAIQTSWSWRDPGRAQKDIERLWSEAIAHAFVETRPVSGQILALIPEDKVPFVHAAVVRKLMELESPNQHDLNGWIQLTRTVLAQSHSSNDSKISVQPWSDYADLWVDSHHNSIMLMGTTQREFSENPEIDIAICVLETAARLPPIHQPIFDEALKSPSEKVQRTAQRLLGLINEI